LNADTFDRWESRDTPVVTGSMRNRVRAQGIEVRGACDGGNEAPGGGVGYPPPGCFAKRGSKLLKTKDGSGRRWTNRLQMLENNGFVAETQWGTELAEPPCVFVSAYSKGVTGGVSVSADSKGLICTKMVQNARGHGSAESKGVRDAAWSRICSR